MRQQSFSLNTSKYKNLSFGGSGLKSNPKQARPFSSKNDLHLVLKSIYAKGSFSFLRHQNWIVKTARRVALQQALQLKDIVVMGNHIHLRLGTHRRKSLANFLRALSGLIVPKVCRCEKGRALKRSFFSGRPFSRIIANGKKSYGAIKYYFQLNRLEKVGMSKEESRKLKLLEPGFLSP